MNDTQHDPAGTKPWERPAEPEHPMIVEGGVVEGDTRFMAVCLFEELLRTGISVRDLRAMSADANYQALFAVRSALGDEQTDALLSETVARVGVHRFRSFESGETSIPADLTIGASDGPCAGRLLKQKGI